MSNKLCLNKRTLRTYDFASLYSFKVTMSTVSLFASILSLIRNNYCKTDYRNSWCGMRGLVIFKIIEFVVPVTIEWSVIGENGIYTNNGKFINQFYNCLPDNTGKQPKAKIEALAKSFLDLVQNFLDNQVELIMNEEVSIPDLGENSGLRYNNLYIQNSFKIKYSQLIKDLFLDQVKNRISFEYISNDAKCPMNQPAYISLDPQINTVKFHVCRSYCISNGNEEYHTKSILAWYLTALGEAYMLNLNKNYNIYHTNPVFLDLDRVGISEYCSSSTYEVQKREYQPINDYIYTFRMFDPLSGVHALCFLALSGVPFDFNSECNDVL